MGHMASETTDTLIKPDMVAVLARTHVSKDLHGFLLPTLEAVSNAMHGIEARFGETAREDGKVNIAVMNLNDPDKIMISIADNGIGLDDDNYRSFKTPFSGYKLKKNGRGFGRFIAFKVFSRILYSSRYDGAPGPEKRTFRFDIAKKNELIFYDGDPDFSHLGLRVDYDEPLSEWRELIQSLDQGTLLIMSAAIFCRIFSIDGCQRSRFSSMMRHQKASRITSETSLFSQMPGHSSA
jgi:hypothetical protein